MKNALPKLLSISALASAALFANAGLLTTSSSSQDAVSHWTLGEVSSFQAWGLGGSDTASIGDSKVGSVRPLPGEHLIRMHVGETGMNDSGGGKPLAVVPGPAAAIAYAACLLRRRRK